MVMPWQCAAIDHGVTVFPFGKIGPCTFVDSSYLKPMSVLRDPQRFQDLKTQDPPPACHQCVSKEAAGLRSFRQDYNRMVRPVPGIQFLDIRNTNLCNLKCRYCGPHFSSQWAQELGHTITIQHQPIDQDFDYLITDSLQWLYFTGGEPLINAEHWRVLDLIVERGLASQVSITYNTNLTTVRYKDRDIFGLWEKFKSVTVLVSIDATGEPLEYIRSGSDWAQIQYNLDTLQSRARQHGNIEILLSPVISILNIWFLAGLWDWARDRQLEIRPNILAGPDYLALNVVPDVLKDEALAVLDVIKPQCDVPSWNHMRDMIENNQAQGLWVHCLAHVMQLDRQRRERLMDVMPESWRRAAQIRLTDNGEYQS